MSRWGALTHLGAFRQKTDGNGKQSMLNFCYEEGVSHIISLVSHNKPAYFKIKLWYLVENKLAELFKAYTFQERIINKKQNRQN